MSMISRSILHSPASAGRRTGAKAMADKLGNCKKPILTLILRNPEKFK